MESHVFWYVRIYKYIVTTLFVLFCRLRPRAEKASYNIKHHIKFHPQIDEQIDAESMLEIVMSS